MAHLTRLIDVVSWKLAFVSQRGNRMMTQIIFSLFDLLLGFDRLLQLVREGCMIDRGQYPDKEGDA